MTTSIRIYLITLLAIFCVPSINAETSKEQYIVPPLQTKEARQKEAKRLEAKYRGYFDKIATLSPSEETWLKIEYFDEIARNGNKYTKRSVDATHSLEYQRYRAKKHYNNILLILNLLAHSQIKNEREEHILWLQLADWLLEHSGPQEFYNLVKRGEIDRHVITDAEFDCQPCFIGNQILTASMILNSIAIPMARNMR